MEFKRVIWLGLALALPLSAGAKPAYLACKIDGSDRSFTVVVDEEAARVTMPDGELFEKAAFSAEEISFGKSEETRYSITADKFTINRVTLAYRNDWSSWSSSDGKRTVTETNGQCEVAKPPERKI